MLVVLEIIMPVFAVIALGFCVHKKIHMSIDTLSFLAVYILAPALFFDSIIDSELTGTEFLQVFVFMVLLTACLMIMIKLWSKLTGVDNEIEKSVSLSTLFPNTGNYGLPVVMYAFGSVGFEIGVIYTALESLKQNTVGVYLASNARVDAWSSLIRILKMPGFWAVLLALGARGIDFMPPDLIMAPVKLLGEAMIPILLFTLGCQLAEIKLGEEKRLVLSTSFVRLVLSPGLGFFILYYLFDITTVTSQVLLVQSATPAAVVTTMLAIRFDARPDIVSSATLISTLISVITVSILLYLII